VHLGQIIVSPQERGRGLGQVLCELLMAEATRWTAAQTITLTVYRDNPGAVAVYAKRDFVVVEGESTDDAFTMKARATARGGVARILIPTGIRQ
jgi:[ribosomal protein S18]-alanine N-acetyltransferase